MKRHAKPLFWSVGSARQPQCWRRVYFNLPTCSLTLSALTLTFSAHSHTQYSPSAPSLLAQAVISDNVLPIGKVGAYSVLCVQSPGYG
eukprot:2650099-Rhodomonas_salina.2